MSYLDDDELEDYIISSDVQDMTEEQMRIEMKDIMNLTIAIGHIPNKEKLRIINQN